MSKKPAQAQVTRLIFEPFDLFRGIGRSARAGVTAGHIDFELTCQ